MKKIFIYNNNSDYSNYINAITKTNSQIEIVISANIKDSLTCDALILTGGDDPNPVLYGEQNTCSFNINNTRDKDELNLINHFYNLKKPIFGICRGLQILNIAFGGTLEQNLHNSQKHSRCSENFDKYHNIIFDKKSPFGILYPKEHIVNSAHHQCIKKKADALSIAAYSDDGIIEAVFHKKRPIWAVQWHPERIFNTDHKHLYASGKKMFEYFLSMI